MSEITYSKKFKIKVYNYKASLKAHFTLRSNFTKDGDFVKK